MDHSGIENGNHVNDQARMEMLAKIDKDQLLTVVQFLKKFKFTTAEQELIKASSSLISDEDLKSEYEFSF